MAGITYREVLLALLALAGLAALARGRDKLRSGFLFFIFSMALGYRTLPITDALRIHPAEFVLWGLWAYLLVGRITDRETRTVGRLPIWLWCFMPFWLVGWIPSIENIYAVDIQISEFRNFLVLVPLYLVVQAVLTTRESWGRVIVAIYTTSVGIAFLGIVEYLFPQTRHLAPGFLSTKSTMISVEGFARAHFSFWGGPHATFCCVLAAPLGLLIWRWWPSRGQRALTVVGLALQVAAVYIGGYRSMWLVATAQFLALLLMQKRYMLGVLILAVAMVKYQALPDEFRGRLESLGLLLSGRPNDSSAVERQDRVMEAWRVTLKYPAGRGWAAAGWVHCDFIQVAANLGLLAGLVFLGAYAVTLARLGVRVETRRGEGEIAELGPPLFLSFVAVGGLLTFEGVEVLPQTALPAWQIWALADTWLRQTQLAEES